MGSPIAATSLWGFRELVHRLGGDANAFLARFGIPPDADEQEGAFVDFAGYLAMLEAAAAELGCPDFGLRLSRWQGLDVLGPVAVIARNSPTVVTAMDAIARYLFVHSPSMRLSRAPWSVENGTAFVYELTGPADPMPVQSYELSMAVAVRIIHVVAGTDAAPRSIAFLHPKHGPDDAYRVLECPVRFDQTWCGFVLSDELADLPIPGADTATRRLARRYLDARYVPASAPLARRVADLARNLLPTGQCSVEAIASALAMQPRTLQRQLAAEGTRCQDVIDLERRRLADRYLANPDLQLSQVAGLIGYTEQSALNRSCKRWFGRTPRQHRVLATAACRVVSRGRPEA